MRYPRVDFEVEIKVARGARWTVEQKSIESATSYPPVYNEPDRPNTYLDVKVTSIIKDGLIPGLCTLSLFLVLLDGLYLTVVFNLEVIGRLGRSGY